MHWLSILLKRGLSFTHVKSSFSDHRSFHALPLLVLINSYSYPTLLMDKQLWHGICCQGSTLWCHWFIFIAPSEDSETRRGGRVQVEEIVSTKDLLSLTAEGLMISQKLEWSHGVRRLKKQERMEFKTGGNTCWKVCVLTVNRGFGFDYFTGRYLLPVEVVLFLLGQHRVRVTVGLLTMRDGNGCFSVLEYLS